MVFQGQQPPRASAGDAPYVGPYRLLTRIGEGGMGVVHLAQGPDGRRVALKVLRPHVVGDDEARERLAREVASLRRVHSPRVAEVIDADPWGPQPYVATRYVPGLSLHQHVRQEGPVAGAELAWFGACLAEAVVAVHAVGVLHRDIKPSNVLLEGRTPVLIDFGLARLAEDPRLTASGWLLGTPGYLAPEILYGEDATTASDVHSWAATVAFASTARPPFGTGPAMAIMDRVRRGEHDLSGVPEPMRGLVAACLATEPEDRPEMAAVLASLRAGLHQLGSGAAARPPVDQPTMPYALFAGPDGDRDPTDRLAAGAEPASTSADAPTEVIPGPAAAAPTSTSGRPTSSQPTSGRPASLPTAPTRTLPASEQRPVLTPAREPYRRPPDPRPVHPTPPVPAGAGFPAAWRPPGGTARLQRGAALFGLAALVSLGFARAPYVCVLLLALATLAVRTFSWTSDSVRVRRYRRGSARWYDGAVAVLSSPWYLLVATGGTVVLLVWGVGVALVVGLAYLLFGLPLVPGLLVMGAALALATWWGPGARRVRLPARRALLMLGTGGYAGWVAVAVLAVAAALCAWFLTDAGVTWTPRPGAPWRSGTMLGDVLHWLSTDRP